MKHINIKRGFSLVKDVTKRLSKFSTVTIWKEKKNQSMSKQTKGHSHQLW